MADFTESRFNTVITSPEEVIKLEILADLFTVRDKIRAFMRKETALSEFRNIIGDIKIILSLIDTFITDKNDDKLTNDFEELKDKVYKALKDEKVIMQYKRGNRQELGNYLLELVEETTDILRRIGIYRIYMKKPGELQSYRDFS